MNSYLDKIIEQTTSTVEVDKKKIPLQELRSYISDINETKGFFNSVFCECNGASTCCGLSPVRFELGMFSVKTLLFPNRFSIRIEYIKRASGPNSF